MRPWNVPLLVDVLTAEVDELTAGMKACKLMEAEQAREAQEAEAEALAGVLGQAQMHLDEAQRRLEQGSSSSP